MTRARAPMNIHPLTMENGEIIDVRCLNCGSSTLGPACEICAVGKELKKLNAKEKV